MQYLVEVSNSPSEFKATYTSGITSDSYDAACFFQIMHDKDIALASVVDYIVIGKMVQPEKPWDEIERILRSFYPESLGGTRSNYRRSEG